MQLHVVVDILGAAREVCHHVHDGDSPARVRAGSSGGVDPDRGLRGGGRGLEETESREKRLRLLPSRVVVYFLLTLALFEHCSYRTVWSKADRSGPGASRGRLSLTRARRKVGAAPLRRLLQTLAGPVAPGRPGPFEVPAHGDRRRDPAAHTRRRDAHLAFSLAGRAEWGVRLSAPAAAGLGRVGHPRAHSRRLWTGVRG
ncbi:transposase domain-containing protein [Streptomyces sp. NPDC055085]